MTDCNQYIELTKPWNLKKENNIEDLNSFLTLISNAVKRVIYYLEPVLIDGTKKAWKQFNISEKDLNIDFVKDFNSLDGVKMGETQPIYLRLDNVDTK